MAARLSQDGVPVKLAIGLDPTSRMTTTGHIDRYINYYIVNGFGDPVDRGQFQWRAAECRSRAYGRCRALQHR